MSFDLGSPVLEIAIALAFVFLLLSLIVTELTELVANWAKLRAKNLKQGLESMLGDKGLVEQMLDHPLIKTGAQPEKGKRKRDPSYISPRNFALVLRDLTQGKPGAHAIEVPDWLATQLRALTGGPSVALPEVPTLEKWFDESMDRVSGWYKRKAKWITMGLAALVVIGLNVSALQIAERLSEEPTVRAAVVSKAEAAAAKGTANGQEGLKNAGGNMEATVKELDALKLPIFWAGENIPDWNGSEVWGSLLDWLVLVVGWLITILAISLGAPFWFDTLSRLSNLRMAGKKPEEKPAAS
jgi:hypothetical protein